MDAAGILGVSIIVIFTALGVLHGALRSLVAFIGAYVAFMLTNGMLPPQGTGSSSMYCASWLGIFIGITVAGLLLYGATKFQPIEALEGTLGFIFGLMTGWGVAKFALTYIAFYMPESDIAGQINSYGSLAWNIFTVAPYYELLNRPFLQDLRNPKIK